MKKMKTIVNLSSDGDYDYGLSSTLLTIPHHQTQVNQASLLIKSVFRAYKAKGNI